MGLHSPMMSHPFKDFVFVFTGEMKMPRDEARERVVLLGARVTTAISGKTTHLITGQEPGKAKLSAAKKFDTKIMNEDKFQELLEKVSPKDLINTRITSASEENVGEKAPVSGNVRISNGISWAEKYRPRERSELIGNPTVISQLEDFIKGKTNNKAALVSGAPGVGKTTASHLLSRINGYEPIEFNASSLRNKGNLQETVGNVINSGTFRNKKRILIMDEVDGMSSDRGGIPELINIIKRSKTLIICICNDRNHPKMRTLANNCLDLRFRKLDHRVILQRTQAILKKENKVIDAAILNEIIYKCSCDMRYVLNTIQYLQNARINNIIQKNISKGVFELAVEFFHRKSVEQKIDMYFEDYGILPLLIQENYIKSKFDKIGDLWKSADSISFGDLVDSRIHGSSPEWSLMPYHAFFSCVYPTHGLTLHARIDFPIYLGQASKSAKNSRILTSAALNLKYRTDKMSMCLYVSQLLDRMFIGYLNGDDIKGCVGLIDETQLTKDDFVALNSILRDDFKGISTKSKTALTRETKKLKKVVRYNTFKEEENDEKEEDI